jgi:hypothetical protein
MKYIKETKEGKQVYEVEIDVNRLMELMVSLDKDCYVRKFGKKTIEASNEVEVSKKIKEMVNHAGLKVNESFKLLSSGRDEGFAVATYKAVYKDSVLLVKYIEKLLAERDNSNYNCSKDIDSIINYTQTIDFYAFNRRIELSAKRMLENGNDNNIDLLEEYISIQAEAMLNREYDFSRLYELYEDVLKCFEFTLVEKTSYYNSGEPCDLIRKLKGN